MNTSPSTVPARPSIAPSSTNPYTTRAFWEGMWRTAGLQSLGCFVLAYFVYGRQRSVAASIEGLAILNLMWFAAAVRVTLEDAGEGGWGAASTASSAATGAMLLLLAAISAARSSGLNDVAWAVWVLSSFPRAMLVMSWAFGLWRARLISNALFAVGVAAVVLGLAGGTTWISGGFWSPDGVYSRVISPLIGLGWMIVVSQVLITRSPATRSGW